MGPGPQMCKFEDQRSRIFFPMGNTFFPNMCSTFWAAPLATGLGPKRPKGPKGSRFSIFGAPWGPMKPQRALRGPSPPLPMGTLPHWPGKKCAGAAGSSKSQTLINTCRERGRHKSVCRIPRATKIREVSRSLWDRSWGQNSFFQTLFGPDIRYLLGGKTKHF